MTTITLTLDDSTARWLSREAQRAGVSPEQFIGQLLQELAHPEEYEHALIDELLLTESTRDELRAECPTSGLES